MVLALNSLVNILQETFTLGIDTNSRRPGFCSLNGLREVLEYKDKQMSVLISPC